MNIPNELIYKDPETIDSLGYSESSVSSEYGTCRSELYSLPSDSQYRIDISQHQKCIDFKSVAGLLSLGSKLEQKIIQKEISRASTLRQESQISVKDEEFKQENLILQERLKNMQTQMNEIRSHFEMEQAKHAKLSDTHEALKVRISGFRQKVKEDLCPKKERDQYHDKAVSLERALEQEKLKLSELRNRSISIENTNKMVFDENTALKKKLIDLENLIDTEYCLITTMKSATQKYDMNLRELKEANCKLSLKIKQIQGQNAEELEHQKVSQQRQILQLSNEKKQLKLDSEKNTETLKIREIELSAIIKTGSNEQKALIDLNLSLETQLQVKSEDLRAASHKIEVIHPHRRL